MVTCHTYSNPLQTIRWWSEADVSGLIIHSQEQTILYVVTCVFALCQWSKYT